MIDLTARLVTPGVLIAPDDTFWTITLFKEGLYMALTDQDGNSISRLSPQEGGHAGLPGMQQQRHGEEMPARGYWVGPRAGDPVKVGAGDDALRLDPPVRVAHLPGATTRSCHCPAKQGEACPLSHEECAARTHSFGRVVYPPSDPRELRYVRAVTHNSIQHLLEHQPMVESQRRILVQALGVLETFA